MRLLLRRLRHRSFHALIVSTAQGFFSIRNVFYWFFFLPACHHSPHHEFRFSAPASNSIRDVADYYDCNYFVFALSLRLASLSTPSPGFSLRRFSLVEKLCFDVCSAILHFSSFCAIEVEEAKNSEDTAWVRLTRNLFFLFAASIRGEEEEKKFTLDSIDSFFHHTRCFLPFFHSFHRQTHFFSQNFSLHIAQGRKSFAIYYTYNFNVRGLFRVYIRIWLRLVVNPLVFLYIDFFRLLCSLLFFLLVCIYLPSFHFKSYFMYVFILLL